MTCFSVSGTPVDQQPHSALQTLYDLRWVRRQPVMHPDWQTLTITDCCGGGRRMGWAAKAAGAKQTTAASAKIFHM